MSSILKSLDDLYEPPMQPPAISLEKVSVGYAQAASQFTALANIHLQIETGKFVAIVGPSGCGKSSLLNVMSGILSPTTGQICHFGEPVRGLSTHIGYASQNDGLLPWKTVAQNMALPLHLQKHTRSEIHSEVNGWLHRTGLTNFGNAYPSQLSGGMRKRVSLVQALIPHPKLVLLDEPLSALDVQTRMMIGNELLNLWAQLRNTIVLVTHDLEEAIGMADEVVVLSARPACVKAVYPIELPRPRDLLNLRLSDAFQRLYARIWSDLKDEGLLSHAE